MPVPVLLLNGSRSSDDFRIVSWRWRRAPQSIAAGTVVLHTHVKPVLMVTDIVPGRYVFELTVVDDQDASSTDTVSVQVKESPLERHALEMTLHESVSVLTRAQLLTLVQRLTLALPAGVRVNVSRVEGELDTDNARLHLLLYREDAPIDGTAALSLVRAAGYGGGGAVARLRTARCLSPCSGRGACDRATRACRCDAFWMQNLFTQIDPDAAPNCDWSVVYASLCGVAALLCAAAAVAGAARGARRLCGVRRRAAAPRTKYRLLPAANREDVPFTNNASDTETDSDVLFESRSRESSFSSRLLNGDASNNNGASKKVKA